MKHKFKVFYSARYKMSHGDRFLDSLNETRPLTLSIKSASSLPNETSFLTLSPSASLLIDKMLCIR